MLKVPLRQMRRSPLRPQRRLPVPSFRNNWNRHSAPPSWPGQYWWHWGRRSCHPFGDRMLGLFDTRSRCYLEQHGVPRRCAPFCRLLEEVEAPTCRQNCDRLQLSLYHDACGLYRRLRGDVRELALARGHYHNPAHRDSMLPDLQHF